MRLLVIHKNIFLLLLLLSVRSWGQEMRTYSIPDPAGKPVTDKKDKQYIDSLIDAGNAVLQTNTGQAIKVYNQVIAQSIRSNYPRGISIAYNNLSAAYKLRAEYFNAIISLKRSVAIRYPDKGSQLTKYTDLADLYQNTGAYNEILQLEPTVRAIIALNLNERAVDIARFMKYIAIARFRKSDYDGAYSTYYDILSLLGAPDSTNFTTFVEVYNGMGAIAARMQMDQLALEYIDKAIAIAGKYKNYNQLNMSLGNRASLFIERKDYRSAERACLAALAVSRRMKFYSYQSLNAGRMALVLNEKGRHKEALVYCKESYDCARKIDNFENLLSAERMLGYTYLQLKEYPLAKQYLEDALMRLRNKGRTDNINNIYAYLAEAYAATGNQAKAYEYMKRYADKQDTLSELANAEHISRIESRYRTAEKDKQLISQQLELTRKETKLREKNLWIGGLLSSTFLLLSIAFVKYQNRRRLQAAMVRNLLQQQEIDRLNARMQGEELERSRIAKELHDGVSVLLSATKMHYTAIGKEHKLLAETDRYQEVMDLLNQTTQEIRAISYNLVPELIIRQSLPAAVQAFCELIQKGHGFGIELQIYGDFSGIPPKRNYVVYRIVQEIIQNILKHAKASEVLLQITLHDGILQLTAEDNGIGFKEETSPAGMGLKNLRDRVISLEGQLLFRSYPDTGTTIEIEIPVAPDYQNHTYAD